MHREVSKRIPRVMITGTGSSCGKTTVMMALLSALKIKGETPAAFKCGPDYIDPMFHREVLGVPSHNLDLFMCGEETVKYLLSSGAEDSDICVIEGAMGIYDGMGFEDDSFSANHTAKVTLTPQLLVMDTSGKGISLAAEAAGYLGFAENRIRGVILNRCSGAMYPVYRKLLKEKLGLDCFGYLPKIDEAAVGSRHLGLVTAAEVDSLKEKTDMLGRAAIESMDIDGILELASKADALEVRAPEALLRAGGADGADDAPGRFTAGEGSVTIAVARDEAFCFSYPDDLALLEGLGARIVPVSPLRDEKLPEEACGLILPGGYPELYLKELEENNSMKASVRAAVGSGMPTIAECGGFMYLGRRIYSLSDGAEGDIPRPGERADRYRCTDSSVRGRAFEMTGALPPEFWMTDRLVRFGYKSITAKEDNLLCDAGSSIRAHEFHYSDGSDNGAGCVITDKRGKETEGIFTGKSIYAGYPHMMLWGRPEAAERFVAACRRYMEEKKG